MTEPIKQLDESVPCRECGRPTWSRSHLCARCAAAGAAPAPPDAPDLAPLPEAWTGLPDCPRCAYSLQGLETGSACPECGFVSEPDLLVVPGWIAHEAPGLRVLIGSVVGTAALLFLAGERYLDGSLFYSGVYLAFAILAGVQAFRWIRRYRLHRRGDTESRVVFSARGIDVWGEGHRRLRWSGLRAPSLTVSPKGMRLALRPDNALRAMFPRARLEFFVRTSPEIARTLADEIRARSERAAD